LQADIHNLWRVEVPELVVAEAPLNLGAFLKKNRNAASFEIQLKLHGILQMMCARFKTRYVAVHQATARKHFLGFANKGDRTETNNAVVQRCRLMKLVPPDCSDWDRCSAICIHDYACAYYGARATSIKHLYLSGEMSK
jgi:hypothetical protein